MRLRLLSIESARRLGIAVAALLLIQIALGVMNVVLTLPLPVATAHNATGALLLLGVITVNYRSFRVWGPPMSELRSADRTRDLA